MQATPPDETLVAGDYQAQHDLLDRCVRGDWRNESVALRGYFRETGPRNTLFTRRRFEPFANGGAALAVRSMITSVDITGRPSSICEKTSIVTRRDFP